MAAFERGWSLFILDKRIIALVLMVIFALTNLQYSHLRVYLGQAVTVTALPHPCWCQAIGLYCLDRKLAILEYETFMLA